jgi:hypothetical protein
MIHPALYGTMRAGLLVLGMVILFEVGRLIAIGRETRDGESAQKGLGVVEGAVFSLLGLLIAFTYDVATMGRLEKGLEEAAANGWAVADM